jgi:hypothetical protein
MIEFEWDSKKAAENLGKHGISFEVVSELFEGEYTVTEDNRFEYGEIRLIATGRVVDVTLVVVFTKRGSKFRIISARKANRNER